MKKYSGYIVLFITTVLLIILVLTGNKNLNEYNTNIFYMNTHINVRIYSNDSVKAKRC